MLLVTLAVACSQTAPAVALVPTPSPSEAVAAVSSPEGTAIQGGVESASPSPSPVPGATAEPVPVSSAEIEHPPLIPGSGSPLASVATSSEPPERDLFALAHRLGKPGLSQNPVSRIVNQEPVSYQVGHKETFFVTDLVDNTTFTVEATLLVVSDNAYWYVDDSIELSQEGLEKSADIFENDIRPVIVASLGDIWSPGVDNDPHLTILHTPLRAADGYYGSSDEYPRETQPHSNQREMIYMDGSRLKPGESHYLSVLAHEFQHAVHWNLDAGEDSWINEGMSEVARELVGYRSFFVDVFLRNPTSQLNFWPDQPGATAPHYGGATLFLTYMAQHYGGYESLGRLVREDSDGINSIEAYLAPYGKGFEEVFKDWVVANYLDADDGVYAYPDRAIEVRSVDRLFNYTEQTREQPQFSARYIDLSLESGDALFRFDGETEVSQVGTECRSGGFCWWSNIGDSIDSTLTREFDLSDVSEATLEYWAWFEIEEDWDYAYVAASTDGGENWELLPGLHTTTENPVGNNFGVGLTGKSGQWVMEEVDLSPYAGGKVLLRFEYITDDAVNLDGFVIDDIAIPEIGFFDDAEQDGGWQALGFKRIGNVLSQDYFVQVVEVDGDGDFTVRDMPVDQGGRGEILLEGFGSNLEKAMIIISPVTRDTYQPARYAIAIENPGS